MGRNVGYLVALGTTLCAFAAVITGARLTSANTISGLDLGLWKSLHRGFSMVAAAGAITVALSVSGTIRTWLFGAVALAAVPGGMLETRVSPNLAGVLHAVAATVMTSVCAAATLRLGKAWQGEPATIPDEGSPSLGTLARITWVGLLVQTALGALYRHQIVGLLPHVAGAMLVMGMVMYAGIAAFSTQHAPKPVKRPALSLLVMTGVQMLFGLGAYLYRIQVREEATGHAAMLIFTVIHVAVGAVTTACCALMGMQISRYVRPAVVAR
ncbi:MAG: hypothetical protein HYX27_07500 [Acidobacteria bacterium]|nr:hypothetical protein [Acidobacteriota bacterium]